jgi:hypothetical protein
MGTILDLCVHVAGRVLWSLCQAVVGVLYPAASRRVAWLQHATAVLLLLSVIALSVGLGMWHARVAWSGVWLLWFVGGSGLLAAGYLGCCVEAACARPASLGKLPFENQTLRD